jgi:hypothetical protein
VSSFVVYSGARDRGKGRVNRAVPRGQLAQLAKEKRKSKIVPRAASARAACVARTDVARERVPRG